MEYEFEPGLIAAPPPYDVNGITPPGTLSPEDKQWALKWYPAMPKTLPALHAFKPAVLSLAAGKQADYAIKPEESRKYTVETIAPLSHRRRRQRRRTKRGDQLQAFRGPELHRSATLESPGPVRKSLADVFVTAATSFQELERPHPPF
jgi:hypothetical protein